MRSLRASDLTTFKACPRRFQLGERPMIIPFRAPIVGARFRPPAETVLNLLPAGVALTIVREPENPYDENAISIRLAGLVEAFKDIFEAAKAEMEERGEWDPDEGLPDPLHLGYVPRDLAATMVETIDKAGAVHATLIFSTSGRPEVEIRCEVAEGA